MKSMTNKVVLVTGAASGIGRATARLFAARGAKVVVSDVNRSGGEETVHQIREAGDQAHFVACDVSQSRGVEGLVAETVERYGGLDYACNNAGIEGDQGTTVDCTEQNWQRVIDINLRGVWLCMKHEIPQMLKRGGGGRSSISPPSPDWSDSNRFRHTWPASTASTA